MRSNEENLDLFADLLEPVAEIISDTEVTSRLQGGEKPVKAIKIAIKNHHNAIVQILALTEGKTVEEYKVPPPALLALKIIKLLNDPNVQNLFMSQGQLNAADNSGSATANTEDGVQ